MQFDPLTIGMLVVLAILVIFMFRNSRKRKSQAEELAKKVVEGAYVMTNFGLYGTILEIDEEKNVIVLETSPGHEVKVHRQTVTRVVEEEPTAEETREAEEYTLEGEPEYGERVDDVGVIHVEPVEPDPDTSKKNKSKGSQAD